MGVLKFLERSDISIRFKSFLNFRVFYLCVALLSLLLIIYPINFVYAATIDDIRELAGKQRLDSLYSEDEQNEIIRTYKRIKMHNTLASLFELNDVLLDAMDFESAREEIVSRINVLQEELLTALQSGESVETLVVLKMELDRLTYLETRVKVRGDSIRMEKMPDEDLWEQRYQDLLEVLNKIANFKDLGSVGRDMPFPLKGRVELTSVFGDRYDPITETLSRHEGVDLRAPIGSEVRTVLNGEVTDVFEGENSGLGVEVTHDDGLVTRYLHLSKALVKVGDKVNQGDVIAESGDTGRGTGPHLHFEVILDGEKINPLLLFGRKGANILYEYVGTTTDILIGNELLVVHAIKDLPSTHSQEKPQIKGVRPLDYTKEDGDVPEDSIEVYLKEGHESPRPNSNMSLWELRRVKP